MGSKLEGSLVSIIGAIKCGYAVITVDYRLATECAFPEFIFDVKTAVRWARAHAEEYSFDPNRFGMIGDSAGGHITLTMAFTADRPEYEGEKYGWPGYSSAIQAACDMYGPSDLAKDQGEFYRASQVKRIKWGNGNDYEVPFGTTKKELLELISPINMVHKNIPPLLIQHGYIDSVVAYQHSTTLKEKVDSVCGEGRADLRIYPDRNHADRGFTTPENTAEVIEFFDKHLK
ncbi:MAG: alpha/beta hydrolase [Oscillospiraceae bacterium]|nr:alpha/beta hydrolase [Oscillospiraceae bacterium]